MTDYNESGIAQTVDREMGELHPATEQQAHELRDCRGCGHTEAQFNVISGRCFGPRSIAERGKPCMHHCDYPDRLPSDTEVERDEGSESMVHDLDIDIASEPQAVPPERIYLLREKTSRKLMVTWFFGVPEGIETNPLAEVAAEYTRTSTASTEASALTEALREMTQVVRRVDYPELVEGREAERGAEQMALAITEAVDKFYEAALAKYEGKKRNG